MDTVSSSGNGHNLIKRPWSPFDCGSTELPSSVLLAAKLLVVYMLVHKMNNFEVFLPFLKSLDTLRFLPGLDIIYRALFYILAVLLFCNRWVRTACFLLGIMTLLAILASRVGFSNSRTFFGCFLMLTGLVPPRKVVSFLRIQVAIVYLGAGLNKLFEPAWRSGQYCEYWAREILELSHFVWLAEQLPPLLLSQALCWLTIVVEFVLAFCFFVPAAHRFGVVIGISFHVGILLFTGGVISWVFCYAMVCSYLVFVPEYSGPEKEQTLYQNPAFAFSLASLFLIVQHLPRLL